MHAKAIGKVFAVVIALIFIGSMFGCAGREFAPRDPYMYWYYPSELPQADRDLERLREACPKFYEEEKARVDMAYEEYVACKTPDIKVRPCPAPPPPPKVVEAPRCELTADKREINPGESVTLSMRTSGEVTSAELEGTRDKTMIVSPTTTTTYTGRVAGPGGSNSCATVTVSVIPPPPPSCQLKADRAIVPLGESVKLTMTTSGKVTSATLENESMPTTGGTIVRKPEKATKFTASVVGPGGSVTCTAPVSVSLSLRVHFPFDRPKEAGNKKFPNDDPGTWFDKQEAFDPKDSLDPCSKQKGKSNPQLEDNRSLLRKAVDFVKNNPGTDIMVTGHTDCMGPKGREEQYNHELSHRRAEAMTAYIKKQPGLGNININSKGLGFSVPVSNCEQTKQGKCDKAACDCRAQNRRVVITVSPK